MSFGINFISTEQIPPDNASYARVMIGKFEETILIPLDYWTKEEYCQQWITSINNLLAEEKSKSALLVEMYNPEYANFIKWWPIYRDRDIVYIQNHILLLDELPTLFKPDDLESLVPNRKTIGENGEKISEWASSVSELREWLKELKNK